MIEEVVGGKVFEKIIIDDRVNPNLQFCLYCKVVSERPLADSRISLNCVNGTVMKQCPCCKVIYILSSPLSSIINPSF